MSKLSVGVIFGGRSVEHDVSIVTAHQVMAELGTRHEVVPVYVTRDGRWLSASALNDLDVYRTKTWDRVASEAFIPPAAGYRGLLLPGGRLKAARRVPLDVVIPCIHGTFGEDGTLQGLLELAGLPYAGAGVVGSAVGMDKVAMKRAFRAAGLPIPDHVTVASERVASDVEAVVGEVEGKLAYPVFVKPSRLGSSVGIAKAADGPGLVEALEVARRYDHRLLVEQAMEGCLEVNCSVLGGPGAPPRPSVCEQPVAWQEFLSFDDKYLRGAKRSEASKSAGGMAAQERRIPAPISETLTKQVQENAVAAFEAVDAAGVARIDSFVREETGETWVMEINTVPGSLSYYLWEASGLAFGDLLEELIGIALTRHRAQGELMFSFDSAVLATAPRGKSRG
ncbi:MAG: D-alanine--D-alanine ligase family protein [Actinomycetota bacterium]